MNGLILVDAFTIGYKCYSVNYSVGVSILYDALNDAKIQCNVLKRPTEQTDDYASWVRLIAQKIMINNPKIVAISARCDTFPFTMDLIELLKTEYNSNLNIILGGPHASICYKSIMQSSDFVDYIIVGEGEKVLPDLVNAIYDGLDVLKISGVVFHDGDYGIIYTGEAKYKCLGNSDIKQYKLILDNYVDERSWFPIEIGRGCQYNCTFCCTTKMWRQKFRLYNAYSIINTLINIYSKYDICRFQFIHDNILSSEEAIPFLTLLSEKFEKYPIQWECSARIDNITEQKVKLLKRAKCCSIYFGFETASSKMQKIYRKNIDLNSVKSKVEILKKYDMGFVASFIIGHPDESIDDISLTLSLAVLLRCQKNCYVIQLHRLSFINGSDIYNQYKEDLKFDGNYPEQKISELNKPIYTNMGYKEIYSYYYNYSKYSDDIENVLNNTDIYVKIINKYSKSIDYIQKAVGSNLIISILDAYVNYLTLNRRDFINEFLISKNLNGEFIQKVNNIINFENLIYTHKDMITES